MASMSETANVRLERIERLLAELQYEVTRGMLDHEIDEQLYFRFIVPLSRTVLHDGIVLCEFRTQPGPRTSAGIGEEARLRIIK